MKRLFDRRISVQVADQVFKGDTLLNGQRVPGFRIRFRIVKTSMWGRNTSEVQIDNISETRVGKLDKANNRSFTIEAGYEDTGVGTLFKGQALRIQFDQSAGLVLGVYAGDGLGQLDKSVSVSVAPGSTPSQVFEQLTKEMGDASKEAIEKIKSGNVALAVSKINNAHVISGNLKKELDKFCDTHKMEWSIQDEQLQVLGLDETTNPEGRIVLNVSTGLIGSPQRIYEEMNSTTRAIRAGDIERPVLALRVKSLLQSGIKPGSQVKLESQIYSGTFKVIQVTHEGDTHGQEWTSEMDMRELIETTPGTFAEAAPTRPVITTGTQGDWIQLAEHYPPFSDAAGILFMAAAASVEADRGKAPGTYTPWADYTTTEGRALHNLLAKESQGYVGRPVSDFGDRIQTFTGWQSIWEEYRAGYSQPGIDSHAVGLGQFEPATAAQYYHDGVAGCGIAASEAYGMINYIADRYKTPSAALAFWIKGKVDKNTGQLIHYY